MVERTTQLETLLKQLDLDQLDRDLFLGDPGGGEGRLFGGMVAAQSVMAAHRTVDEGSLHSMHAYFLRPGRHGVPIRFVVYRIRDGRTFTTRDVVAHQAGEAIFQVTTSFTKPEEGYDHQEPMPQAPDPEECTDWDWDWKPELGEEKAAERRWTRERPLEIRNAAAGHGKGEGGTPQRAVWVKMRGQLPEDERIHAACIAYASDSGFLATARHVNAPGRSHSASLDHSVWFHYPARFDDWLLFTSRSPMAHGARALIQGEMFTRGGRRVVSVTQEGLVRIPWQAK
jgi:acyl-CoA thioesterase-2